MPEETTGFRVERIRCLEVWGGNLRLETQVQVPGLDIWLFSRPLGDDVAGGDVYYISSCAAGRLTRILLADVSGHGERVAHVAGQLQDLMRKNIEVADHRRFVTDMNRQFEATSAGDSFATAVICSFFAPTRSLLLCNAGHPPPLLYRCSTAHWECLEPSPGEIELSLSRSADLPLGILPQTDYAQRRLRLAAGDAVLCFTDAFSEAQRADQTVLGTEGLLNVVAEAGPFSDGADLIPRLIRSIRDLAPQNLCLDDCTLVLFRATGRRFRWRDQLMAPFRHLFSRVSDACHIGTPQSRAAS